MSCHVEVNDPSSVVREEHQDVKRLEGDGGNNKEVNRDNLYGVVLQKRFPALLGSPWGLLGNVP